MRCCARKKKTYAEMTRMERVMATPIPNMTYTEAEEMNYFKTPTDENELHPVMMFWNMQGTIRADQKITNADIKDEGLQLIFEEKTEEALVLIQNNFIKNKWANDF